MNPVAQDLTQWRDEAIGRPLQEVFRIVSEETRLPAEDPVSKAIHRGVAVGLANHTILIARDGTELPIDDSSAPIRNPEGKIVGIVLVFRDITDRRQADRRLAEANRRKDEFLAMLAHELRNPLAPIRNAAHLLGLLGSEDERVRRIEGVIERQVGHMTRLVDDLLDISRITSGKITLQRAPVAVRTVLAQAVETARPLLAARKQTLEIDVSREAGRVDGDPARLAQVVGNLLDNAIKYTDEGGRIWLTARKEPGEAVIGVRDEGVGIPGAVLPHVFDLFTQADSTPERTHGGLGVGLTLVRRLVEMHGGSVHVFSEGPGEGSEFVVRLPLLADAPQETDTDEDEGAPPRMPRRILVVDDHEDSREMLAMLLRLHGHDVRTAADGPTAFQEALKHRPDVVLLDPGLPGVSGYDVARRLRTMPGLATMRLVP